MKNGEASRTISAYQRFFMEYGDRMQLVAQSAKKLEEERNADRTLMKNGEASHNDER